MRILLLTHILPPGIDGGSKAINKLGTYLSSKHQVLFLTSNCKSTDDFVNPGSLTVNKPFEEKEYNYSIIRLPVYKNLRRFLKLICLFLPKNFYLRNLLEVFQKGPIFKIIPIIKSLLLINKFKPDYIIAGPLPTAIVIYAYYLKKLFKTKLIINASFHPTDPDFFKKPLISSLANADLIWALTDTEKSFFIKKLNLNPKKIITLGNGVGENIFLNKETKKTSPTLLYIGNFSAHKNISCLIDAFVNLTPKYPTLSLHLAGQKTLYYPVIENKINNLPPQIQSKIKLIFNFPDKKLIKLLDESTILIQPSFQESFGLVLIEAWSRKKPVICSDIPSMSELINNAQAGLTFNPKSYSNLSDKIDYLLSNSKVVKKMGENGYSYTKKHYTWDTIVNKLCRNLS